MDKSNDQLNDDVVMKTPTCASTSNDRVVKDDNSLHLNFDNCKNDFAIGVLGSGKVDGGQKNEMRREERVSEQQPRRNAYPQEFPFSLPQTSTNNGPKSDGWRSPGGFSVPSSAMDNENNNRNENENGNGNNTSPALGVNNNINDDNDVDDSQPINDILKSQKGEPLGSQNGRIQGKGLTSVENNIKSMRDLPQDEAYFDQNNNNNNNNDGNNDNSHEMPSLGHRLGSSGYNSSKQSRNRLTRSKMYALRAEKLSRESGIKEARISQNQENENKNKSKNKNKNKNSCQKRLTFDDVDLDQNGNRNENKNENDNGNNNNNNNNNNNSDGMDLIDENGQLIDRDTYEKLISNAKMKSKSKSKFRSRINYDAQCENSRRNHGQFDQSARRGARGHQHAYEQDHDNSDDNGNNSCNNNNSNNNGYNNNNNNNAFKTPQKQQQLLGFEFGYYQRPKGINSAPAQGRGNNRNGHGANGATSKNELKGKNLKWKKYAASK